MAIVVFPTPGSPWIRYSRFRGNPPPTTLSMPSTPMAQRTLFSECEESLIVEIEKGADGEKPKARRNTFRSRRFVRMAAQHVIFASPTGVFHCVAKRVVLQFVG